MPRPSIDPYWQTRIDEIGANERTGAGSIFRRFEQEAAGGGPTDYPSETTIRRRLRDLRRPENEAKRQSYRWLYWPESFEGRALPWQDSATALTLLRWCQEKGRGRPTIGLTRWFCRASAAAPRAESEIDFVRRLGAAALLFYQEAAEWSADDRSEREKRAIEGWVAHGPAGLGPFLQVLAGRPDIMAQIAINPDFVAQVAAHIDMAQILKKEAEPCEDTSEGEASAGPSSSTPATPRTARGSSAGKGASQPGR